MNQCLVVRFKYMRSLIGLGGALLLMLAVPAEAQRPRSVLGPGSGAGNYHRPYHLPAGVTRTLSSDTTYVLTGWTFVDSLATLIIPAGTVVRGDKSSMGSLIVCRGGKIIAQGTKEHPIVFTSDMPRGARAPGDWGGIVICGAAPTNNGSSTQAEGGFGNASFTDALYGGANSGDSSGVLRYVRIEFPGDNAGLENEINGLTLAGVGRGTVIDHVQVSFSNDDDIQFFGGTVDARCLISWRCRDDNFDTEYGHDGRLQFLYAKRDPSVAVQTLLEASNGIESDNNQSQPFYLPVTKTRISNLTLIGPAADTIASKTLGFFTWYWTASLQSGTRLSLNNSLLLGFDNGIVIWDSASQTAAVDGAFQIRNTSLQARKKNIVTQSAPIQGFNAVAWFVGGTGNTGDNPRDVSDVGITANAFLLSAANDPVPVSGSEPDAASSGFAGALFSDPWFDPTAAYRGAFIPGVPMEQQWTAGWSQFDPENYEPEVITIDVPVNSGWNIVSPAVAQPLMTKNSLFPHATGVLYGYEAGEYFAASTLEKGRGYWASYMAPYVESDTGAAFDSVSITLTSVPSDGRWIMLGALSSVVPASSLSSIPPEAIRRNSLYEYDGAYVRPSSLMPGKGYWLYITEPCSITVKK